MSHNNNDALRLAIVDDEPLARSRLRRLLDRMNGPPVMIVLECGTAAALVSRARTVRLDAVFIDIEMPGRSGLAAVETWSGVRPEFVFVTAHHEHALKAFDLQAADYLTKPVSEPRLGQTLVRLWKQRRPGDDRPGWPSADVQVSARQIEILTLLEAGLTNKEIARALGLSHFTVRNHVTSLFRRFSVSRRGDLTRLAKASGLVTEDVQSTDPVRKNGLTTPPRHLFDPAIG